ncbi:MAG: addiction module protein [Bacteroidetes bacterium]|nr:addiction module protein [Bacteroidota bacterium]MBU1116543.1 addiction module protein [Bacteroidota bacterium]MBU1796837.1 addiction module protein [Bacteroidota bacterium]
MENISKIIKKSVLLTSTERIFLVNALLESLDKPDEEIEKLWVKESEVRYNAYKSGKLKSISWNKIKAKYES